MWQKNTAAAGLQPAAFGGILAAERIFLLRACLLLDLPKLLSMVPAQYRALWQSKLTRLPALQLGSRIGSKRIPPSAHARLGLKRGAFSKADVAMPLQTGERAVVHVVDDDPSLRRALADLFDSVGLATRTYATARDLVSASLDDMPGCLVIDVRLPDMNGLEFQARLSQMGVRLPVVMMTGYGDIPMSVRAMKRGAVDFLAKPFRDQDMLDAVMAAIERDRQRRVADKDLLQARQRFATLSDRERQVMLLVAAGKMNKQVAGDLGISEITVKIHRGAAMRKMGARTLAHLVRLADLVKPKKSAE